MNAASRLPQIGIVRIDSHRFIEVGQCGFGRAEPKPDCAAAGQQLGIEWIEPQCLGKIGGGLFWMAECRLSIGPAGQRGARGKD